MYRRASSAQEIFINVGYELNWFSLEMILRRYEFRAGKKIRFHSENTQKQIKITFFYRNRIEF